MSDIIENINNDVILKVEHVSKTFGTGEATNHVLTDVSLEIKKGEFIGISGLSGNGKTTLVDIIAGLLIPQNGKIIIDGIIYKMVPYFCRVIYIHFFLKYLPMTGNDERGRSLWMM